MSQACWMQRIVHRSTAFVVSGSVLTFIIVVSAFTPLRNGVTASRIAGHDDINGWFYQKYSDPDCPGNPDSFAVYVAYGTGDVGDRTITDEYLTGYTSYVCEGETRGGHFRDDPVFQECWDDTDCTEMCYSFYCQDFPYSWEVGDCWGEGQSCSENLANDARITRNSLATSVALTRQTLQKARPSPVLGR